MTDNSTSSDEQASRAAVIAEAGAIALKHYLAMPPARALTVRKRKEITQRMVLEAYAQRDVRRHIYGPDILRRDIPAPNKVIHSAIKRELDRGMIEFGISLKTGWLTYAGEARLAELRGAPDV